MNVLSENRLKGTFVNQGVSCAATLHRPTIAKGPYPTILMVHGWLILFAPRGIEQWTVNQGKILVAALRGVSLEDLVL